MNQIKWEDLRPAYQQVLLHVHEHGTLPEDTPECYEVASSLIANYQFMKLVPASITVHPGEEYCLTDAGKDVLATRDDSTAKFSAALTMIGTNEKVKAANRRAIRTSITDNSNAVDVFAVLADAGFEWNGTAWVEIDSDDPLTNALLEGDYAGIRKLFEELKAERDAANKRRSEVDAEAAVLRSALEHYTDAEVVTDWGAEETRDDGAVARDALNGTAAGANLMYRLEYLEGMNLGRERVDGLILELVQKHAPYVEHEELASPQLVEAIDKHVSEMAARIAELTQQKGETLAQLEARAMEFVKRNQRLEACKVFRGANYSVEYANAAVNRMFDGLPTYTQLEAERDELKAMLLRSEERATDLSATISGLEDTCIDLARALIKANGRVKFWKRIARSRINPNGKVIITPADRVDYEHIRTGVISISPEAHKAERERRCKAIEASIRKCIKLDAIKFVGRIEVVSKVEQGVKEGAE